MPRRSKSAPREKAGVPAVPKTSAAASESSGVPEPKRSRTPVVPKASPAATESSGVPEPKRARAAAVPRASPAAGVGCA